MKIDDWKIANAFVILALVALLLLAGDVFAGTATVTWTNPTARTDGTALPSSQIGGSRVEWGTCSGSAFGTAQGTLSTTGAATSAVINDLAPGTWCFRVSTFDTGNVLSSWSNIASKVVPVAPPNPPVIVTVSTYAYEFRQRVLGGFKLVRVADVQMGAPCAEIPGLAGSGFGIADGKVAICGPES